MRKKSIIVWIIFFIVFFVSCRAAFSAQFFRTHDYIHGVRIAEMLRALREGQFPVIWTSNFGYGYGMPLFEFYAPFPFYVGAAVYWLTQRVLFAVRILWIIPSIVTFWGAYALGTKLYSKKAGIVVAMAATLAPYRAVDLYVRGAISELWAMMVFPWIIYGVLLLFDRNQKDTNRGMMIVILSLSVMMLSHNLMTMMFFPFVILLTGLLWSKRLLSLKIKREIIPLTKKVSLSLLLPIGISSFYLFPALLEKDFTQVESRILSGYFHYSQHFLYIRQFFQENWKYGGSVWGPNDDLSFFLGYGQILLFSLFILSILIFLKKKLLGKKNIDWSFLRSDQSILNSFFVVSLGISLFFTLQKSEFIWKALPPLQVAQFPWRFLSLATIFLAVLCGAGFQTIQRTSAKIIGWFVFVLLLLIPAWTYFSPEEYLQKSTSFYYDNPQRVREEMSEILPDYIPTDLQQLPPTSDRFVVEKDQTDRTTLVVDRGHEVAVATFFSQPTQLIFNIAYYPGWQAYLTNTPVHLQKTDDGRIAVDVPAGPQLVAVRLEHTPIRWYASLVTVLSIFVLVWMFIEVKHD